MKAKVVVERQSGQRAKFLTTCYVFKEGNNRAEEILAVEGTALALLG